MKKLLLVLWCSVLLVVGCGDADDTGVPPTPETDNEVTGDQNWDGPTYRFAVVQTPNGPVECIYGDWGKGGGPSCNWEKFNNEP